MRKLRKSLLLPAALSLCILLGACGGGASPAGTETPKTEETPAPEVTEAPVTQTSVKDLPVPEGALDFSGGKADFIAIDPSAADADPDTTAVVVDHNGGKALRISAPNGKTPYVAIDAASLLGDRLAEVRRIELRVAVEGDFFACSGGFHIYAGEQYDVDKSETWAVFLENKNPNLAVAELEEDYFFVNGTKNFFTFYKLVDNAVTAGEAARDLLIDYIAFYDADGKVIPANPDAVFDPAPVFNQVDTSFLTALRDVQAIEGAAGSCVSWSQAVTLTTIKNDGGTFDPALLEPGCIITVYYNSADLPELVLQSWTEGAPETMGWAKITPFAYNWQNNTAQFRYEDMVATAGTEDIAAFLDKLYIGATFADLDVSGVTIGYPDPDAAPSPLVSPPWFKDLGYAGETPGGWGQAVAEATTTNEAEPGGFDPAWIAPGHVFTVKYTSDAVPELIVHSYNHPGSEVWGKVAASYADEENGIAQYTYEDIVAAFGSEDFTGLLDKFYIGDCGAPLVVHGVTIRVPNHI